MMRNNYVDESGQLHSISAGISLSNKNITRRPTKLPTPAPEPPKIHRLFCDCCYAKHPFRQEQATASPARAQES